MKKQTAVLEMGIDFPKIVPPAGDRTNNAARAASSADEYFDEDGESEYSEDVPVVKKKGLNMPKLHTGRLPAINSASNTPQDTGRSVGVIPM